MMKMTRIVFCTVALSLLLAGAVTQAAQVTGTVTNKTTGKPAAGDAVVLVDVQAGMGEVAKATTDAGGHYKLTKPGQSNYLVRVTHQGATYFIGAPEGGVAGDVAVYDVSAKVDGVLIDEDVIGIVESVNGQLRIVERYAVRNSSMPPRTQWSPRSFEIVLPEDAVVEGASAQRPGASSLPTTMKLDPAGPKGHYSFNFPIQPDDGEKPTLFQIEYMLPYGGKFTFHPQVTIPARTVWVMMPKSMSFTAGAGSTFISAPQEGLPTYVAKSAAPGKPLEFTVSGTGSIPRDEGGGQGQQADSGQEAGGPGTQPGGGMANPINTPDPLSKYKWWILSGILLLLAVAAGFLLRKPAASAKSLEQRYHDGYLVASTIVFIGTIVKFLSLSIGAIIVITVLVGAHNETYLEIGITTGVLLALSGFAIGVLISAQGQIMQSMIDTAINTSPLIDAAEKARIIGIAVPNRETPHTNG